MSKWTDFSLDERKAMIQGVVEARQIDEAAAEKDWNFTKFLIDKEGNVVKRYEPTADMAEIENDINAIL